MKWYTIVLAGLMAWAFFYYQTQKNIPSNDREARNSEIKEEVEKALKNAESVLSNGTDGSDKKELEDFVQFKNILILLLPSSEDLRREAKLNPHASGIALVRVAQEIGKFTDAVYSNPKLKPEGLKFFIDCYRSEKVVPSVRAVCFERADALNYELNRQHLGRDLPPEVLKLLSK